ncbi:MAG: ORF6N domain-containing protein [Flavobacteriales bacterium]|jgi:hypothetical protein|nr:ORF6N domain-containing protein [Flavobacteriales bacterium]NCG29947.1 ORF6N domain-containing protein [Bacteroidota bacterium]MBT3963639.1 ORF6N domain-containing protein [Flavobacteriales bacterium]MBT4705705.1 ORF6N domain-containing protein [Flavobacteriales bacterium]MBT4930981.1 ORF6N domain-containing protein [Flavobacteriales bacterium]
MNEIAVPEELILIRIHEIRNKKVMLDRDLAHLFGVETRVLKQAVRRNVNRFPRDFMFVMSPDELEEWRSQTVMSKADRIGLRHSPFCFTEQGIAMLASVLNSEVAIQVNIQIIRVFTKMREMMITHKDILLKVEEIERQVTAQDEKIVAVFNYLKEFVADQEKPRTKIGYK